MTSPVHVQCTQACNTKAWFRNVNVGDWFCNLGHAPESTRTTIVKQDQWICVIFFLPAELLWSIQGFFNLCYKRFWGLSQIFGSKSDKICPKNITAPITEVFSFPFFENVNNQFSLIMNLIIFAYKEVWWQFCCFHYQNFILYPAMVFKENTHMQKILVQKIQARYMKCI
jgi:hypothetical protein